MFLTRSSNLRECLDFCLWAPQKLDSIADTEGEEVAWCTKKGHGTRIIPEGTILGAQLLKTSDYVMITGLVAQSQINIPSSDYGGELDSGGQDGVSVNLPSLGNQSIEPSSRP